jgi:hypothetical protein
MLIKASGMSEPKKLPPHEVWDALVDMALHDEAERLEKLSSEELDRELIAAGRDPAVERAKVLALVAEIKAKVARERTR